MDGAVGMTGGGGTSPRNASAGGRLRGGGPPRAIEAGAGPSPRSPPGRLGPAPLPALGSSWPSSSTTYFTDALSAPGPPDTSSGVAALRARGGSNLLVGLPAPLASARPARWDLSQNASAGHLTARREDDLGAYLLAEPDLRPQGLDVRVAEALDGPAALVLNHYRVEALVCLRPPPLLFGGRAPRPAPRLVRFIVRGR